ncbi:BPSL0761 family protein [Pseudomonas sp. SST3]|nr:MULTISPECIES: BPSL0761 family protein [Pseudomonadaceae]
MTMPNERTRAVIQTREFLVELSRDSALPDKIRKDAKFLLRHFPSTSDMRQAGRIEESSVAAAGCLGPVFSSTIEF